MSNALSRPPAPCNEPVKGYAPGSPERASLRARLTQMAAERVDIPCIIGGKDVRSGRTATAVMPHDHAHVLADVHLAGPAVVAAATAAAAEAWPDWSRTPWEDRAAIFLRAAELLAGPWRDTLNAATMLGQSKSAHQAEIDSACELIDFWRFNPTYAAEIYADQPTSSPGVWNRMEYRPLEGFVFAVTPFNFTAIGGNLPTAPAILGNTVVWKPAATAMLSAWTFLEVLREAGLPDGVINLVAGPAQAIGQAALTHRDLAGVHFTGSTEVFHWMWKTIGEHIGGYRTYPRIVGETGGKDFILAHETADVAALCTAIVRGGFEYQGQKCSAASRVYVPDVLWPTLEPMLRAAIAEIKVGDVADLGNFMGAVIDDKAFASISGYLDLARHSPTASIVAGGRADGTTGWFIDPTVVQVTDPRHRLMSEEIFGPVVTLHVYPAARWQETLRLVDETSPYALTGAVFARDRGKIAEAARELVHAAGNFYINDKPTGAVVGQQPFGGARASGTNDKAGSALNLSRWVSMRSVKETLSPPTSWRYPFLG
jgi:1-pyrroline-5-carboxylate dehydrogenase